MTMIGEGTLTLSPIGSVMKRMFGCDTRRIASVAATLLAFGLVPLAGCGGSSSEDLKPVQNSSSRVNSLSSLYRVDVGIRDTTRANTYDCWLAANNSQRLEGLSYVSAQEMPAGSRKGMVFVYRSNQIQSFYGKDTFIPLDVAFAEGVAPGVGRIVKIATISAFQRQIVSSGKPVRYVLEVRRGDLALSKAKVGDTIYVPVNTPAE